MENKSLEKTFLLARLELEQGKKEKMVKEVMAILDYVKIVNQVEGDLNEFPNMSGNSSVLREDNVKDSLDIKQITKNAPKMKNDYFELEGIF